MATIFGPGVWPSVSVVCTACGLGHSLEKQQQSSMIALKLRATTARASTARARAELQVVEEEFEDATETVVTFTNLENMLNSQQHLQVLNSSFSSRSDSSPLAWHRANSSVGDGATHDGFGRGGDVRWADLGGSCMAARRPSTALEAGRSKAKKGQTSSGRIERRSFSSGTPKPSNLGRESQDKSPVEGNKGIKEQQQRGDGTDKQIEGSVGRERNEEELNSTWQDLGLVERRAGGRLLPGNRGRLEATRVGGWGRDKSMQRRITPEEQRETRGGRRERARSGVRLKTPASGDPVVKKPKKKWDADFDPDPRVRHPPEYYINGPYGPHAWKGVTVGKIIEGTWSTNQVVYFSNVEDDAEAQDRAMYNVAIDYANAVAAFDPNVGIQYFYVFARRRLGPRPDPWADWTLVAQLAVESGTDLGDQGEIFRKIGSKAQDIVTQCVAWVRPDLTFVKKPRFHMRLERQEEFLKELFNILDPNRANSFYATLCRLVNVDIEATARTVRNGYEALDEQGKMECMKHVFDNHPVKVLSSERYERERRELRGDLLMDDGLADNPYEDEHNVESYEEMDDEEVDAQADQDLDRDMTIERSMEGRAESGADRNEQFGGLEDLPSDSRVFSRNGNTRPGRRKRRSYYKPVFRSGVRPYSYSNIIEEIAEIRTYLFGERSWRALPNLGTDGDNSEV